MTVSHKYTALIIPFIAIIGILATIVLTSLGSARSKAQDAKAQATLSSMRAQAELFYSTYGHYGVELSSGSPIACSDSIASGTIGGLFADDSGANLSLYRLIQGLPTTYTSNCYTTPSGGAGNATAWAVTVSNGTDSSWCVDSTGQSKAYAGASTAAADGSTSVCD